MSNKKQNKTHVWQVATFVRNLPIDVRRRRLELHNGAIVDYMVFHPKITIRRDGQFLDRLVEGTLSITKNDYTK